MLICDEFARPCLPKQRLRVPGSQTSMQPAPYFYFVGLTQVIQRECGTRRNRRRPILFVVERDAF